MKYKLRIRRRDGITQRYTIGNHMSWKEIRVQQEIEKEERQKKKGGGKGRPKLSDAEQLALFKKRTKKLMIKIGDNAHLTDVNKLVERYDLKAFPEKSRKDLDDLVKKGEKWIEAWNKDPYSWNQKATGGKIVVVSEKGHPVNEIDIPLTSQELSSELGSGRKKRKKKEIITVKLPSVKLPRIKI